MRWRVLGKQILPSRGTLVLLWIALGVLFFGSLFALVAGLSRQLEDPVSMALAILGAGALPACALLTMVGAVREKRSASRAILWLLAWGTFCVSAGLVCLGIARDPDVGLESGALCYTCTCAPFSLILFIPAGRFIFKALPELRQALADERERKAVELAELRGEVNLSELSVALELDAEHTTALVHKLITDKRLIGELDAAQSKVYTLARLQQHQERLLAIVHAHGRISLEELGRELGVPRETLKNWIYELVRHSRFVGALNWSAGVLYSAEASQLLDGARCPHCGGELTLAGVGVIGCQYCGAEIFLPHDQLGRKQV